MCVLAGAYSDILEMVSVYITYKPYQLPIKSNRSIDAPEAHRQARHQWLHQRYRGIHKNGLNVAAPAGATPARRSQAYDKAPGTPFPASPIQLAHASPRSGPPQPQLPHRPHTKATAEDRAPNALPYADIQPLPLPKATTPCPLTRISASRYLTHTFSSKIAFNTLLSWYVMQPRRLP